MHTCKHRQTVCPGRTLEELLSLVFRDLELMSSVHVFFMTSSLVWTVLSASFFLKYLPSNALVQRRLNKESFSILRREHVAFLYNGGNKLCILIHFLKCCRMIFCKTLPIIPGFPSYKREMGILFQISDAIVNTC